MKILIVGMGYVGSALAVRLLQAGHEVWGQRRSLPAAPPSGVHFVRGDASEGRGLSAIPSDLDAYVLALAPDQREDEAYRRAYPMAATAVARAFPKARAVLISSTTVYDQGEGAEVTDESPALSGTFSAVRIRQAEEIVLRAGDGGAVLRASGIYGPGRVRLASGLVRFPPEGEARRIWTNRIHRDDLAKTCQFFIERPALAGVYLASDPTPCRLGDLADFLGGVPHGARLARLNKTGTPSGRARKSRRFLPQKLPDLGFEFGFPSYREGYDDILAALPTKGS